MDGVYSVLGSSCLKLTGFSAADADAHSQSNGEMGGKLDGAKHKRTLTLR